METIAPSVVCVGEEKRAVFVYDSAEETAFKEFMLFGYRNDSKVLLLTQYFDIWGEVFSPHICLNKTLFHFGDRIVGLIIVNRHFRTIMLLPLT